MPSKRSKTNQRTSDSLKSKGCVTCAEPVGWPGLAHCQNRDRIHKLSPGPIWCTEPGLSRCQHPGVETMPAPATLPPPEDGQAPTKLPGQSTIASFRDTSGEPGREGRPPWQTRRWPWSQDARQFIWFGDSVGNRRDASRLPNRSVTHEGRLFVCVRCAAHFIKYRADKNIMRCAAMRMAKEGACPRQAPFLG